MLSSSEPGNDTLTYLSPTKATDKQFVVMSEYSFVSVLYFLEILETVQQPGTTVAPVPLTTMELSTIAPIEVSSATAEEESTMRSIETSFPVPKASKELLFPLPCYFALEGSAASVVWFHSCCYWRHFLFADF